MFPFFPLQDKSIKKREQNIYESCGKDIKNTDIVSGIKNAQKIIGKNMNIKIFLFNERNMRRTGIVNIIDDINDKFMISA